MAFPPGTILDGKFKIVQVLGEGGMGTVYKVEQMGTTPPYYYAVKELLINPNTSEEDRKAAIERFNKEIDLLRGLKHPRIAALMLPFQERGNYYFVMEFVPGRSLEKILEDSKGPLPEEQTIKWMMQVCEALSYIHSRNPPIILRDLKPGNIMITPDNEVQLIDFGIARRFDPNKRTNTENLGTISYASPEHLGSITMPGQRRTAQNPGRLVQTDARSDIYSLGATMYHVLTGYEPDPIQTPAQGSILSKNPRLRTIQVGNRVVCPVEQVIIKAMQQDPAQRFQSADAMRMALQQCLPAGPSSTVQIPAISPNATIIVPTYTSPTTSNGTGLVCPKCGFQNRPGAKFCKRDGQPLVQGVVAPPQYRVQAARAPIRARPAQPVQSAPPVQRRPTPIQARPVSTPVPSSSPIRARPVSTPTPAPNDPNAAYRLGLQNLANKQYAAAVNQFKLAKSQKGAHYDVVYNLGRAYRQYGQSLRETDKKLFSENMKLAAEQFEEAVGYKSDALDAYFQLGMCYRDLALYPKATAAFKKALDLAPRDPAIYYQLGMAAMEQGYLREAEAYFLDGLRINPDHALILIAIGRLYIETKQIPSAISTLRQATQRDPALWEGWYELGRAHMKAREWKLALSALEQARQVGSQAPEIYSSMATCYLKMNKKVEARQMVNETLQRDPNNAEAIRLQKQL
jgi:serine/threonine protein kinase/Tfp pilus assembly protein PilF